MVSRSVVYMKKLPSAIQRTKRIGFRSTFVHKLSLTHPKCKTTQSNLRKEQLTLRNKVRLQIGSVIGTRARDLAAFYGFQRILLTVLQATISE